MKFSRLPALALMGLAMSAVGTEGADLGGATSAPAVPTAEELKAAKAAAKEAAKLAKEAEKAAKAAAKEAEKEAAKLAKEAAKVTEKMPEQNGIRRPKAGTACAAIWDILDAVSTEIAAPASIGALTKQGTPMGLNDATMKTQYARWRKFHGVTGYVADPIKEAEKAAKQAEKEAAKAAKEAEKHAASLAKAAKAAADVAAKEAAAAGATAAA